MQKRVLGIFKDVNTVLGTSHDCALKTCRGMLELPFLG